MVALIENRAREVGMAVYSLRSFHVELRQYCDSNSFSTTLAALAVTAYVDLLSSWRVCSARGTAFLAVCASVHYACIFHSQVVTCWCGYPDVCFSMR